MVVPTPTIGRSARTFTKNAETPATGRRFPSSPDVRKRYYQRFPPPPPVRRGACSFALSTLMARPSTSVPSRAAFAAGASSALPISTKPKPPVYWGCVVRASRACLQTEREEREEFGARRLERSVLSDAATQYIVGPRRVYKAPKTTNNTMIAATIPTMTKVFSRVERLLHHPNDSSDAATGS